ncbi:MAG TPA: CHAT domain-containing tetratricopeptide repeat protein [Gemmatimonadaceae bacterium]|nr:CHAT domain-containing tetratricopeptide repeat protein [Gemmatimonadaceae bacterium]
MAGIYNFLGLPDSALGAAESARALLARATDPSLEPMVRAVYGETQQYRGRHDVARSEYARGLAAARAPELAILRGRLCMDLGAAFRELGDLDSAEHYLSRALALREALGDREGVAVTLGNLGRVLQDLGRVDSSLVLFDSVLAIRRQTRNTVAEAAAWNNKGHAYYLLELPDSALACFDRAAGLVRGRNPSLEGLALNNRGRTELALGQLAEARRDLDAGRALKRLAGDSTGESWALQDLGRVELAERRWDAAIARLDSARVLLRRQGDRVREGSALYHLGTVYHTRGRTGDVRRAVAYYDSASAVRAVVGRTTVRDEDRVVFAEQDVQLTARWALAWLSLSDGARGDSARHGSLLAAERGRARALRDLLRTGSGTAESELLPTDTMPGDGYPRGEALLRAPAATRAPVLSYLVTEHALLAWVALPSGDVRMHCQRVDAASVDTLVAGVRAQLWAASAERATEGLRERRATFLGVATDSLPASCVRTALSATSAAAGGRDSLLAAAARLLLPPVLRTALPADTTELVVIPHGALALVPFAALPLDAAGTPLGVRYALRYAPSLALLAMVERDGSTARPSRALIVGDPEMPPDPDGGAPFSPLGMARQTAVWLSARLGGRALVGTDASEAAVLGGLGTAELIHFGTHGRAYGTEARARRSFVALAPTSTTDGLLTMSEVMTGPRLSASLVVLSACETGLGDLKGAEGTVGLQRAFLARGARSVLVTLWQVDTVATDSLVRKFYRYWLDERAPRTKAEALRLAQVEVRGLPAVRSNPAHYWAGFQLVGAH